MFRLLYFPVFLISLSFSMSTTLLRVHVGTAEDKIHRENIRDRASGAHCITCTETLPWNRLHSTFLS
jgi:hypothetical protein